MDDDSFETAVCKDGQEMEYDGTATELFWIFIPFCVIILLVRIISRIAAAMNKEQNHTNVAALVLTALVPSLSFTKA